MTDEPRALGTSPDHAHPLRGRAASHFSDPFDPYAESARLERALAKAEARVAALEEILEWTARQSSPEVRADVALFMEGLDA